MSFVDNISTLFAHLMEFSFLNSHQGNTKHSLET